MTDTPIWQTEIGDGPLVACAIHDGHDVRPDVAECLRLDDAQRRYEEDPYTGAWTSIAPHAHRRAALAVRSRFQPAARQSRLHHAGRCLGARGLAVLARRRKW